MNNIVKLNLPAFGHGEPPEKGNAIVEINGVPIGHVKSIKVDAHADKQTSVEIAFYAELYGKIQVFKEDKKS